jgi:nicotinamide-nucleotide amidase
MNGALVAAAESLLADCRARKLKIATAESCTGGLIAATLTEIAGSSDVVERGFVTYSNEAKMELLGVPTGALESHGAVSAEIARAMVEGALARSRADIAVAVTGIAGPTGGSAAKPVGLVHFAAQRRGQAPVLRHDIFPGGRSDVRRATVGKAFELLRGLL